MDSSGQNSTSTPFTSGKTDPAWEHVTEGRAHDGKKTFTCLYCGKITKGGGINRMKQHLAGKSGEVGPCKKVPADIRFRMEECLKAIREKKRPSEEAYEQSIPYGSEIIEWVGVSNVVHMVTDNGANYVAAGRLINETYMTINWSPCAAHCLNLILGEISKMTHIHDLAIRASKVTRYVYNRPWLVAWLRKRKGWTEIVRPRATRFATTFIALHSTHKHMHDLKALVTSKDFVDSRKPEVMSSFLDLVDTKATCSKTKLLDESRLYRDRLESFGRELALTTCKTTQPDEWWRLFGHSAPNFQKLAIRILSQTSSSSGCERNWSVFERIHTKKRNRLEHQRLNDLVFVHYNLRLQNRHLYKMKNNYDPVDIESIDKTEFWIVEEEEDPPLLDYDELEQMLNEDGSTPQSKRQCNRPQDDGDDDAILEIGDDIDLECFGNTNIIDEQNAQDGRDDSEKNEDENEDDWLTRGLSRN
ncbi:hAT dimerization domain-containing protein [Actinidia rufa]|uniref:HAT dimerization domain-containing protein n=1 Tax=Actinidia rufa TaxID=165716 RepID=A0A7J0HF77_9ERIC|nr:hAT dimerization domain-containing protein [Actinidia rufa]